MPIFNNVDYLSLPQQVQKNKNDIADNLENQDIANTEFEDKNSDQDEKLDEHDSDIEQLQDAVAAGGVIVTRKIGLSADLVVPVIETKINFDVETEASNEPTAMDKDVNNDTTLITDGKYKVEVPVSVFNEPGGTDEVTLKFYIKDNVSMSETFVKEKIIAVQSGETVNTSLQSDYTKSGNTKTVLIYIVGDTGLTLLQVSESHVTSYFTVAGTGVVTKTSNIGPVSAVDEGIKEDEITIKEIFENLKSLLIEYDIGSSNTFIKRNGVVYMNMNATGINFASKILQALADPVDAQDAVTKNYLNKHISRDVNNVYLKGGDGDTKWRIELDGNLRAIAPALINNIKDPVSPQDVVTKIYSDLKLLKAGGTMAGNIDMDTFFILMGAVPTADDHLANKKYVDDNTPGGFTEGVITNGVLSVAANAYISHECQKIGKHVIVTCLVTGTASGGNILFTLPSGFRPSAEIMGFITLVDGTQFYVTLETGGDVIAGENVTTGDKTVSFSFNLI